MPKIKRYSRNRNSSSSTSSPNVTQGKSVSLDEVVLKKSYTPPTSLRYLVYDQFRNESSNIAFLIIEGEHELHRKNIESNFLVNYMKHFQAILFNLELRFYGKSRPTEDLSVESLRYLSSQQVLADSAYFIKAMNKKYNLSKNVKWIAVGYSYAGSLAVWLRLLYPHFLHGVISIGAPLLAKMNHEEGVGILADVIRNHSEECLMAIKHGVEQTVSLLKTQEGEEKIYNLFKLCTNITNDFCKEYDLALLFLRFANNFGIISQLSDKSNNYKLLTQMCGIMTNATIGSEVARFAKVNNKILEFRDQPCLDCDFERIMRGFRDPRWDIRNIPRSSKQWSYQLCTELGFFITSDHKPQIFGNQFPLDFFVKKCQYAFTNKFNHDFIQKAVDRTNFFYGGKDIRASNVVFVYGSLDSWGALGVKQTTNKGSSVIIMDGYGHDAGLRDIFDNKTRCSEVKNVIIRIQQSIESWITS